jgi:hypothetical protein
MMMQCALADSANRGRSCGAPIAGGQQGTHPLFGFFGMERSLRPLVWEMRLAFRLGTKPPPPSPVPGHAPPHRLPPSSSDESIVGTATGGTRGALLDFVASLKEPGAAEGRVL